MASQPLERLIWTPEMSVNNQLLDEQHQVLINVINWMVDCVNDTEWDETIVFRHLRVFEMVFVDHLRTEEKLLHDNNYPQYEAHLKSHEEYEEQVLWLITHENSSRETYQKMLGSLIEWITSHILHADTAYREYVNTR